MWNFWRGPFCDLFHILSCVVNVDAGLVCLAGRMSIKLFLSVLNFEAISALISTHSCHCRGDFWLIIGTFLAHYPDNLPNKRNREFANVPPAIPQCRLTKLLLLTKLLGG